MIAPWFLCIALIINVVYLATCIDRIHARLRALESKADAEETA